MKHLKKAVDKDELETLHTKVKNNQVCSSSSRLFEILSLRQELKEIKGYSNTKELEALKQDMEHDLETLLKDMGSHKGKKEKKVRKPEPESPKKKKQFIEARIREHEALMRDLTPGFFEYYARKIFGGFSSENRVLNILLKPLSVASAYSSFNAVMVSIATITLISGITLIPFAAILIGHNIY